MSGPAPELGPGRVLGPYQILGRLGRGGMGTVYRARDAAGTEVALKVIAGDDATDPTFLERFKREAAAAGSVVHPNVARCLGSGEAAGRVYMALELVPGGTLAFRLHRAGALPWRDAARLGAEIASALEAVHAAGLVHRDLKPQNVLLDAEGRVKLTDFGIARGVAEANRLTRTGELLGTGEFMAPEQAGSSHEVDARADLYSLGATLFMLVTGRPPFPGALLSVLKRKLSETAPRLRSIDPSVPRAFDELVASLLAATPGDRPSSAHAVRQALEAALGANDRPAPRGRRVALALGLAALAAGTVALALLRPGPGPPPPVVASPSPKPRPSPAASSPSPRANPLPAWFRALPEGQRPALPLPSSLDFGSTAGEYVAVRDRTLALVFVPAGEFEMGSNEVDNERPVHAVALSPFFMGKYEVTTAQFRRWVESRGSSPPSFSPGKHRNANVPTASLTWETPFPGGKLAGENDPVVQIEAEHAIDYAAWVGLDLPTEAQWEYAASFDPKASEPDRKRRFAWGSQIPDGDHPRLANLIDTALFEAESANLVFTTYTDGVAYLAPVGSFPKDLSPAGCFDMTGNAREICKDFFDPGYYQTSPARDPCNTRQYSTAKRTLGHSSRGGSWGGHVAGMSLFSRYSIEEATDLTGFRVALTVPGK